MASQLTMEKLTPVLQAYSVLAVALAAGKLDHPSLLIYILLIPLSRHKH